MAQQKAARSDQDISAIMRKVRSGDTTPEVVFRKALWARGVRYRIAPAAMPGKPDVVIASKRIAVFIDGDFWHGNQWRRRGRASLEDQFTQTRGRAYWLDKIRRNMQRDCRTTAALIADGWTVLRFWESDIRRDVEGCVQMTVDVANGAGARHHTVASLAPQKTVAEFFAGIGLMRLGLERKGWSVAFANDIDRQKYDMYRAHFGETDQHILLGDVHNIPVECVPTVTLATASFPCNDLSLAGARRGLAGKESSAFWGFARILDEMGQRRPPLVLLENVPGFLTSHGGSDFEQVLLALNRLGYSVDAFALDAARFVPQSRPRLFVVGVRDDGATADVTADVPARQIQESLHSYEGAGLVHYRGDDPGSAGVAPMMRGTGETPALPDNARALYESDVRPRALAAFIRAHPHIRWAVRDVPPPPTSEATIVDILEDIPQDSPVWWRHDRAAYLLHQMSPRHRATADAMIADQRWSYGTVFRRVRAKSSMAELRTDGLAGCLRTPRGGSGRQILFKAGYGHYAARLLTPRECARLMGADEYIIDAAPHQALFGFGDAVCVPVIAWIAEYYLNPVVSELIRNRVLS
jgi:DNA (cytosine-5)-methyltransferase 1